MTHPYFKGDFLQNRNIFPDEGAKAVLEDLRRQGKATVLVAVDGVCVGGIALSDVLRAEAPAIIEGLHNLDTETVLLTGDHDQAARHFAQKAGVGQVRSQLLLFKIKPVLCPARPKKKAAACAAADGDAVSPCSPGRPFPDRSSVRPSASGTARGRCRSRCPAPS